MIQHPNEAQYLRLKDKFEQAMLARHSVDVSVLWNTSGSLYLDRTTDDLFRMYCYGAINQGGDHIK